MRVLVTGATGFIGKNLVDALLSQKHEVFALVRPTSNSDYLKSRNVNLVIGDVVDFDSLVKLISYGFDAVYHCAAYVDDKNWDKLYQANVIGTDNVCRFCFEAKIKKLIYLSSVSVVSGNLIDPLQEDLPYKFSNLYGKSKMMAEQKVMEYRAKGLAVAVVRPCMIYGEDEPHMLAILFGLLRRRMLPIVDGGEYKFHLVYIKNVVDVLIMALHNEALFKDTFFVADEEVLTTKEVFFTLAQSICAKSPVVIPKKLTPFLTSLPFVGKRLKFFLKDRSYDISRLKSIGWKAKYHAQDSLLASGRAWYLKRK